MTGNKVLLDTNIIVALLQGEKPIAEKIDKARDVSIPIIVVGELYYGASYSANIQKNTREIQKLASKYSILTIDEDTTVLYGSIKAALRRKGKPIPENDIWISAVAQRFDLTLISRDAHFSEVEHLKLKKW